MRMDGLSHLSFVVKRHQVKFGLQTFTLKKQSKIAIEIQWSPQNIEETKRRQEKYIASGIRTVWFIRTTQK